MSRRKVRARDIARQWNVSIWSVYDWVRAGRIPSIRIPPGNRSLRFDPQAVVGV